MALEAGLHNRLFHRYPVALGVRYDHDGAQATGTLTNVSVGGAFVETNAIPGMGDCVQLTVIRNDIALIDLRVTVVRLVEAMEDQKSGFGCSVSEAMSNHGEEHLCAALEELFGMHNASVRAMSNPADNSVRYVHRFPKLDPKDDFVVVPEEKAPPEEPSATPGSALTNMMKRLNDFRND